MQRALDAEATSFPRKAMSPHTPGQPCQPWPRASLREEQWVAEMKVTCAKWRPARCPRPTYHKLWGHLSLCPVPPSGQPKLPPNPCPPRPPPRPRRRDGFSPREPRAGGIRPAFRNPSRSHAHLPGHSPAENWPWADPRGDRGERSKSATKTGSAAAAVSMSTLGEVSSSFAKSCPENRREIHYRGAGRASRDEGGKSAAARRHFFLLRGPQTTLGAQAPPASPAGCGGSSPCSAEAAPVSQELLCSGRDGGGAGGDVAPRAPGASEECRLGRGAAASCRRDARQPRPRAPRLSPPLFAARRRSRERAGKGTRAAGCPVAEMGV